MGGRARRYARTRRERRARRWGRYGGRPETFSDRVAWVAWWVVLPVLAVGALPFLVMDLPETLRAARGEGVRGTFVVTSLDCARSCSAKGDFTSDDRSVVLRDIPHMEPERGWAVGGEVAVQVVDGAAYRTERSYSWLLVIGLMVASVGFLVVWGRRMLGYGPPPDE